LKSELSEPKQTPILKHGIVILSLFFITTRIIIYLAGIRFDASSLPWFYQYLDPLDLKSHLCQSLWYLHSQPPGFNIFLGSVLKLANGNKLVVFKTIYLAIGFFMSLALYTLLKKLHMPKIIALLTSIFFAAIPPVLLFENWLFYTYPIAFLLLVSGLVLSKYLDSHKWHYLFLFFLVISLIVMTRSLFHILWFVILLIGILIFQRRSTKKILLCALFPFLMILSLYLKNFLLFDQTTLTSWSGMNLIKMTFTIPFEKLTTLIDNDEISEIAAITPFSKPGTYEKYANFDTTTAISVLDRKYKSTGYINFNHVGYISVSKKYYSVALHLIKKYPDYYCFSVAKAFYAYLKPCSDILITAVNDNRQKINLWVQFYEDYLLGNILSRVWQKIYVNRFGQKRTIHFNFLYFFIPIVYVWGITLAFKGKKILNLSRNDLFLYKYFMFNIAYVTIIGNFFEVSENMRFRFLILPFTYILIAAITKYIFKKK